ncbi:hypothetical protein A5717_11595 [Mycolicibacterium porcinum]|uniref:hypothetical protein n=1 Tax=Mycolicibacterium porcinum TaxID=39693 RepID=UPI00080B1E37|nr:hypothetical protein [Mycolicibacterium porcinum]OCB14147.1 hypothetical protein A5717_11595 [Mycolicibacterium porcinum]
MAQVPTGARSRFSGLYGWLADREERAALRGFTLSPADQPSYIGSSERLAALRAGEPVNIRAADLPPWARVGVVVRWWTRVVVAPDGTVTYEDDDGSRWMAENEL